jgi:hypothetical protein
MLIGAALVAGPAQERIDLGLQGGLQQQPHAQAGDVLQDLSKGLVGREQLVDLGTGAFGGQYSSCHGRRSSFVLSQVRGNLRPLRIYTRDRTPPQPTTACARQQWATRCCGSAILPNLTLVLSR